MTELAPPDAAAAPRRGCRRWLAWGAALTLVGLIGFRLWLETCFATPPPLANEPAIVGEEPVQEPSGRLRLGRSWFLPQEGHSLLSVEGDPFTLGYANARLTRQWLVSQEEELFATVRTLVPSLALRWMLATAVLINNRSLPDYVDPDLQLEILGLARAGEGEDDPFNAFGPRYHRILNYHAAHDISHWVWDRPVVGCSAFAARGRHVLGGSLLVGRAFDFEAGRHFDTRKIIGRYRPDRGHAFLSVVWPGMAGAVTGINDAKIFCSINGAHSSDRGRIGTPVSLVVRRVLQDATNLEEAIRIVREARVFVTDSYLIADGKTGEAVAVEKTPAQCAVRPMADDLLIQTNHFESAELAGDPGNVEHMGVGTTVARHERLEELLHGWSGRLDPAGAVAILRDRAGLGGAPLALGHRSSLNPLIATHVVVADVTRGILWVSRGPHQLGAFDAYTLDALGGPEPPAPPIPADPLLETDALQRLGEARAIVKAAADDPAASLDAIGRALELNPNDPHALLLLARGLEALGRRDEALAAYRDAAAAPQPFGPDRAAVEAAITRLGSP